MTVVMDLARLRLTIADGHYAIDPIAVAEALLRVPDIARLFAVQRPTAS
jgi:hypothetical protein